MSCGTISLKNIRSLVGKMTAADMRFSNMCSLSLRGDERILRKDVRGHEFPQDTKTTTASCNT